MHTIHPHGIASWIASSDGQASRQRWRWPTPLGHRLEPIELRKFGIRSPLDTLPSTVPPSRPGVRAADFEKPSIGTAAFHCSDAGETKTSKHASWPVAS